MYLRGCSIGGVSVCEMICWMRAFGFGAWVEFLGCERRSFAWKLRL